MKLNNKKGISLIVLVITIIVMIVLAAAIILSLQSSGIIGRANEAKSSSDVANKKHAATLALAEYELAKQNGETTDTATKYVQDKLNSQNLDESDVAVTENGDILVGIAALFVNNNVAIGTEIKGYKLNNTTSYTTSGKENTCDANNYTETNPQSDTLQRQSDTEITWKYMGIDENGEALLVGSVTSNSPKMILGGKGGYLNGPQELNDACEALYSSSMGTARSINIDDVTRVLEYTGERGSYTDPYTMEYMPTPDKVMTINEIAQKIGYNMSNFASLTPEAGKDIGSYKSDYYYISKTVDAGEYTATNENLIYPGLADLTTTYWLASPCVEACFESDGAYFYVRHVSSASVDHGYVFDSYGDPTSDEYAVRPVVSLKSNIQLKYENSSWVIY